MSNFKGGEDCWNCDCATRDDCLSAVRIAELEASELHLSNLEAEAQRRIAELEAENAALDDRLSRVVLAASNKDARIAELEALLRRWNEAHEGPQDRENFLLVLDTDAALGTESPSSHE